MKEFKFCGEITEYVEIPVYVCETQKEMVKEISEIRDVLTFVDEARENLLDTAVSNEEETSVYIIYKDGSIYFKTLDEEEGKFKRYGIKAAVIETAYEYTVFGDFAVTDNGDISIEESDIEEYGVYAGQYDVKEQTEETAPEAAETAGGVEETTVSETETVEETAEQETELNAEVAQVEAEQTAEPETFSYEFNEIHKITISKRNNVYVEEFFERMVAWYDEDTDSKIRLLEVERTDEEVEQFRQDLEVIKATIQEAVQDKNFYKNTCHCNMYGRRCEYSSICLNYQPNAEYIDFYRKEEQA